MLDEFRTQWGKLCEQVGCEGLAIDDLRPELSDRHSFAESIIDRLLEGLVKAGLKEEKADGAGG